MKLSLAYSPCPNDTFMFHALASGMLGLPGCTFDIRLHDVETLNREALAGTFDITKLSFHAWLLVRERYRLLNAGAALGFGCGPLIVANRPVSRADLAQCRVAIPGEHTTAHLLLRLYAPAARNRAFTTYDRVFPMLLDGAADCGVIIHESRFTYARQGLHLVADLGAWWEEETSLPIPLGCVAARRDLPETLVTGFEAALRESIRVARSAPTDAMRYAGTHAAEMESEVLQQHIDTYVNEFSVDLGEIGNAAVVELERRARLVGMIM